MSCSKYSQQPTNQSDVVIFYDERDDGQNGSNFNALRAARALKQILPKFIKVRNGTPDSTRPPIITLFDIDYIGYGGKLNTLKEAIQRSTYTFILLTPALNNNSRSDAVDEIIAMKDEVLIHAYQYKPQTVIPVFTMTRRESRERGFVIPVGLQAVNGIEVSSLLKNGDRIDRLSCVALESLMEEDLDGQVLSRIQKLLNLKWGEVAKRKSKEIEEQRSRAANIQRMQATADLNERIHRSTPRVTAPTEGIGLAEESGGLHQLSQEESNGNYNLQGDTGLDSLPLGKTANGHVAMEEEGIP